jgi:hypothetical protein
MARAMTYGDRHIGLVTSARGVTRKLPEGATSRCRVGALKECVGTRHIYAPINHFCASSRWGADPPMWHCQGLPGQRLRGGLARTYTVGYVPGFDQG